MWVFLNYTFIGNHGAQCAHDRVVITLYAIKLFASVVYHKVYSTILVRQKLNIFSKSIWGEFVAKVVSISWACKNVCMLQKTRSQFDLSQVLKQEAVGEKEKQQNERLLILS